MNWFILQIDEIKQTNLWMFRFVGVFFRKPSRKCISKHISTTIPSRVWNNGSKLEQIILDDKKKPFQRTTVCEILCCRLSVSQCISARTNWNALIRNKSPLKNVGSGSYFIDDKSKCMRSSLIISKRVYVNFALSKWDPEVRLLLHCIKQWRKKMVTRKWFAWCACFSVDSHHTYDRPHNFLNAFLSLRIKNASRLYLASYMLLLVHYLWIQKL